MIVGSLLGDYPHLKVFARERHADETRKRSLVIKIENSGSKPVEITNIRAKFFIALFIRNVEVSLAELSGTSALPLSVREGEVVYWVISWCDIRERLKQEQRRRWPKPPNVIEWLLSKALSRTILNIVRWLKNRRPSVIVQDAKRKCYKTQIT